MPSDADMDDTLDSSASTPSDQEASAPAGGNESEADASDLPNPELDALKAYMSGTKEENPDNAEQKPKPADTPAGKDQKQAEKPTEAKPKADQEPANEEAEASDIPRSTSKRIQTLLQQRKDAVKALDEYKQQVEKEPLHAFYASQNLTAEASLVSKEVVADAVRFQASLVRLSSGKGTDADRSTVATVVQNIQQAAEQLGLAKAPEAPASKEILDFIDMARAGYGMDEEVAQQLREMLSKGKQTVAAPTPPAPAMHQAPAASTPAPAAAPQADPSLSYYESMLAENMRTAGFKDEKAANTHLQSVLIPSVKATIAQRLPGQDFATVWNALPAAERFRLVMDAQKAHADKVASIAPRKPSPAPVKPLMGTPRPGDRQAPTTDLDRLTRYMTGE